MLPPAVAASRTALRTNVAGILEGLPFGGWTNEFGEDAMIFWRVKPLDKILETAERKSL